jgi:hypothetical protein
VPPGFGLRLARTSEKGSCEAEGTDFAFCSELKIANPIEVDHHTKAERSAKNVMQSDGAEDANIHNDVEDE